MKSNYISKGIIMLLALAGSNYSYAQQATVVVNNPTDAQRQELVEVNISDVKAKLAGIAPKKGEAYIVKNKRGQQIGSQITHDGKLLIDASIRPHGSATYYISIGKPYPQKVWTTGALYKMRKDDIAWENDRCAYRVYGPALQRTGERSFGTDIWAKNTPDTVVYERYVMDKQGNVDGDKVDEKVKSEERKMKNLSGAALEAQKAKIKALKAESYEIDVTTSFHLDHGNGLDPYRVGATLGLGAPSLMIGNQQFLPYCYKTYKILDNGPLRFTVELTYNPTKIKNDEGVVEHRIISLDKGSNFNKMVVWYTGLTQPCDLAAGVVVHTADTESVVIGKNYVQYADPTEQPNEYGFQIYVGALFPEGAKCKKLFYDKPEGAIAGHAVGVVKNLKNNQRYTYYFGSAWSCYDVRNQDEWQLRINGFMNALESPLKITIE